MARRADRLTAPLQDGIECDGLQRSSSRHFSGADPGAWISTIASAAISCA